jgi:predicted RNA-binding protein YlqC (UPF0109 family)
MVELLHSIVEGLVEDKNNIVITEKEDETGAIILTFTVSKSDMGRVIGKQGKIAKAIRTILRAGGARQGKKVLVEIVENQ